MAAPITVEQAVDLVLGDLARKLDEHMDDLLLTACLLSRAPACAIVAEVMQRLEAKAAEFGAQAAVIKRNRPIIAAEFKKEREKA